MTNTERLIQLGEITGTGKDKLIVKGLLGTNGNITDRGFEFLEDIKTQMRNEMDLLDHWTRLNVLTPDYRIHNKNDLRMEAVYCGECKENVAVDGTSLFSKDVQTWYECPYCGYKGLFVPEKTEKEIEKDEQLIGEYEGLIKALKNLDINLFVIEDLIVTITKCCPNRIGAKLNNKGERLSRLLKDVVHLANF